MLKPEYMIAVSVIVLIISVIGIMFTDFAALVEQHTEEVREFDTEQCDIFLSPEFCDSVYGEERGVHTPG